MNDTMTPEQTQRALKAVIIGGFLAALGISLVSFTLPLVSMDARITGSWLGTGFAGFFFARMMAGPLAGIWGDRVGARVPLLAGVTVGAIAPLVYLMVPSLSALYLIQFILGIVSGLVRPVGLAILGGNAPDDTDNKWFIAQVLAFNVAIFIGPLVGGVLYWNRTMEPVLIGLALCMVIAHVVIFFGVPPRIKSHRKMVESSSDTPKGPFLGALMVAIFGRTFGLGVMITFYPVLLALKLGTYGMTISALFALPGLFTCIGLPLGPWMRNKDKGDPVVLGMLLSAAGLIVAGVSREMWHFIGAGVAMGLGSALSITEAMRLVSTMSKDQGRIFGMVHLVTGLGFVTGPIVGGLIVRFAGDVSVSFILAGLIGWFCLLSWDRYDGWDWSQYNHMGSWLLSKTVPALFLIVAMVGTVLFHIDDGKADQDNLYRYSDVAMGTVVNLTLEADSRKAADDSARKAFAYMRTVQRDLDFRAPNGSVAKINRGAGRYFVDVSKRAYALIRRATDLSELTGGTFDPTIGALTTSPLYYVLDETIAESKKDLVDYRLISFHADGKGIQLEKQGMALDLGGIAKGTIIDGTVKLLRKQGVSAGIVEAGGDFYCFGERDWTVGIRHPRAEEVYGTVTVREKGVCGSGDYQQFIKTESSGEEALRHHIINPADMEPADTSAGVTVIADSAELADGLATTLFIMGPNKGAFFVQENFPGASAMWFTPDMKVSTTNNFPKE